MSLFPQHATVIANKIKSFVLPPPSPGITGIPGTRIKLKL